jgi:murein DD-endopeptidase MepM/ murein hydrolase activator NlpD
MKMTPPINRMRLRGSRAATQAMIGAVLCVAATGLAMAERGQRTSPVVAAGIALTTAPEADMRLHRAFHPAADPVLGVLWSQSHDLIVPVAGVEPGELNDTFTQPRGGDRRHEGIDILAPRGAAVVAATDGVILRLTEHDSGGITLYQLAPDGATVFYYAHLEKYAAGIAPGVAVRQGDVIAYVGDTGNAGAGNYHLHFEVLSAPDPASFWAARPRNPYPLLTRARG